jgi:hypothetical protein
VFDSQHGQEVYLFSKTPIHYDLQWLPEAVFPEEKRLVREADCSPYSAEVKNEWSCTSIPRGVHRDSFAFTMNSAALGHFQDR